MTTGFETANLSNLPTIDLRATGEQIRRLRTKASISVRDLSRAMYLADVQSVYRWQRGVSLPSLENLVLLSWLLGVPIEKILVIEFK